MRLGGYFFTFGAVSCPSDCREDTDFFNNEALARRSQFPEFYEFFFSMPQAATKENEC